MAAAWNDKPATSGSPERTALVNSADALRWSAPELTAQFAGRALAADPPEADAIQVRAQALLAGALVRLGRQADAVDPAIGGLRAAELAGAVELATAIRLDLAACTRGIGEPLIGCAILGPVLELGDVRPAERAIAIWQLVGCTAHVGRRDDLEDALTEADRLLAADDGLSADARRMERALLCVRTASYHRRYGDTEDAVGAARDGLGMLSRLRDARLEGGQARARLTLELVCALLDDGELAEGEEAAAPLLAQPVRATAAAAVGRLMLAMSSRVYLPAGRVAAGRGLLGDAAVVAERHGLDWLLADALTAIAHLDEQVGRPSDALQALRAAHAAEHRHLRAVASATRLVIAEFGVGDGRPDVVNSLLRSVIRSAVPASRPAVQPTPPPPAAQPNGVATRPAPGEPIAGATPSSSTEHTGATPSSPIRSIRETDAATGLLNRDALFRRLEAVRGGDRPVALTLVRLGSVDAGIPDADDAADRSHESETTADGPDEEALSELAGRVRDIAPDDAELARSDGRELAVLLPHTTRDEAEEFAATIRETAIESDWLAETRGHEVSISTGVAQSESEPGAEEGADALLAAARSTFTSAEPERVHDDAEHFDADWSGPNTEFGCSVLSALSIPAGSGGKRRANGVDPALDNGVPEDDDGRNGWAYVSASDVDTPPRQSIPPVPEPSEVPEPPRRPDIPDPPEPDPIPPTPPEPGPIPPGDPPPEPPEPSPLLPDPETVESTGGFTIEAPVLGPVQGPAPRPPDLPVRHDRPATARRERSDSSTLADLLAGALAAYQSTTPEPPSETADAPAHHRAPSGAAGRHRSPDWMSIDQDR